MAPDWQDWHREYDDPQSRLSRRLRVVQDQIRAALDRSPPGRVRVLSLCAGEGRDLLEVLADHPRASDVCGRLVELDSALAARAAAKAPARIEVVCGDASTTRAFEGAAPADLVLACGIFGNVSDDDVRNTVRVLPALCSPRATVLWTRHRRAPDLTPRIRAWFGEAGFEELAFVGSEPFLFGVGAHRLVGAPQPFAPGVRLFTVAGFDVLARRTTC